MGQNLRVVLDQRRTYCISSLFSVVRSGSVATRKSSVLEQTPGTAVVSAEMSCWNMREQVAGFADADSRELDLQILFRIDHSSVNYRSLTPRFLTSPCRSII